MRTITGPTDPAHGVDLETPVNLTPQRPPPDPRPSLCEAGPCRHYHRFAVQVDAEPPKVRRLPVVVPGVAGDTYQPPATFHTETHRYCYPDTGIEMSLGVMPVTECNRWDPVDRDGSEGKAGLRRAMLFWASPAGQEHRHQEGMWQRRQIAMSKEAEEAEQLILDAQVEAELAHYSFAAVATQGGFEASVTVLDAAGVPIRWDAAPIERDPEARIALDALRIVVRAHIRNLILNNEPLPSTLKETDEHRTTEE